MKQLTRSRRRPGYGRGLASARRRFERRAARARRRPWLVALVATVVVLLAGGAVWLGWFSSLLLAERVDVRGVGSSEARVVREVAAVSLGGPLMRVDTRAATNRLEQDRRWVDVSVARRLPHSVVIEVTPRVAVLAVRGSSGALELYDRDGVAFRTVAEVPDGLPLVSSTTGAAGPEGVRAVLQALAALDRGLREAVTDVALARGDRVELTLETKDGRRTVLWGGPDDAAVKAKLVAVLMAEPGRTIDVSVPEAPVTR
ncbi:MAG TPA: FtsQ-type POTRA domain-containing protein [Intrasporangium sp.]|uniref:cell division protein FtsQ/DivIB n=1 Tax=Intrasporangium sp. TaxID=1925024 RepID=UPI002B492EB3|nr:FtsQ-type POTRA domain-containing protein [Intrasporangium sp.]HKX66971.1 FtsQ-type POTRA domain-containing protein [Intrasporangium sp.]